MGASLETVCSILRVGSGHATPYDRFTWSCTVRWIDPQCVELLGVLRAPTPPERRAIASTLWQAGVRRVVRERVRTGGRVDRRTLTLRRPSEGASGAGHQERADAADAKWAEPGKGN